MEFIKNFLPINTREKILQLIHHIKEKGLLTLPSDEFVNQVCLHIGKKNLQVMFREKIYPLINLLNNTKIINNSKKIVGSGIKTQSNNPTFSKNSLKNKPQLTNPLRNSEIDDNYVKINRKGKIYNEKIIVSLGTGSIKTSTNDSKVVPEKYYVDEIEIFSLNNIVGKNLNEAAKALNMAPKFLESILIKRNIKLDKNFTIEDFYKIKADITPFIKMLNPKKFDENNPVCNYAKKYNQRFSPSLGKEGNYYKLIYIRTKT